MQCSKLPWVGRRVFLARHDGDGHFSTVTILAEITSDAVLDAAYEWLCRRRRDYSANADVWAFRRDWAHEDEERTPCTQFPSDVPQRIVCLFLVHV
jgi:hypothetical protein